MLFVTIYRNPLYHITVTKYTVKTLCPVVSKILN